MNVYSSTDVGAPQISSSVGVNYNFLPVLRAVLVDGYGSTPGAGWTEAYNATGIKVFKQNPSGSNSRYFRVWDGLTAVDADQKRHFRVRGYESMTAVSTGTGPFPTTTQVTANGLFCTYKKEVTYTDGTTQYSPTWTIFADGRTCYVFIDYFGNPSDTVNSNSFIAFGSFDSDKVGDTFNDMVWGNTNEYDSFGGGMLTFDGCLYVTRSHTGISGSIMGSPTLGPFPQVGNAICNGNCQYPDPVTNSILMAKIPIATSPNATSANCSLRGKMRWLWAHPHPSTSFPNYTTFTGSGAQSGRTFQVRKMVGGGGTCNVVVETSDTWA